jgi:hypothetical protein
MTRLISGNWEKNHRNENNVNLHVIYNRVFQQIPWSPYGPEFDRGSLESASKVLFLCQSCVNRWINWSLFWYWNSPNVRRLFRAQFSFFRQSKNVVILSYPISLDSLFVTAFLGIFPIIVLHVLVFLSSSRVFYVLNLALLLQCNRTITADRDRNSFKISYDMVSPCSISDYPLNSILLEFNYCLMFVWCVSSG